MSRAGGMDPRDPPMPMLATVIIMSMFIAFIVSVMILLPKRAVPDMSTGDPGELRDFVSACRMSGGRPIIREIDVSQQARAPVKSVRWAVRCQK